MGKYTFIALTIFLAVVLFTLINTVQYGSQYRSKVAEKFKEKDEIVRVAKANFRKDCIHTEQAAENDKLDDCAKWKKEKKGFDTPEQIVEWARKQVYEEWEYINIQTIEVMGLIIVMFCIVAIGILIINVLRGWDIKLNSRLIPTVNGGRKKAH